jgi:hypothetical protein
MKLSDLDPKLTPSQLRFTCPLCGEHAIVIPLSGPHAWGHSGTVADLTVRPSINALTGRCHWHGFVTNGAIVTLPDSQLIRST